jgi:hypothetical protein
MESSIVDGPASEVCKIIHSRQASHLRTTLGAATCRRGHIADEARAKQAALEKVAEDAAAATAFRERNWPKFWSNLADRQPGELNAWTELSWTGLCERVHLDRQTMWALLDKYSPDASEANRAAWQACADNDDRDVFAVCACFHDMIEQVTELGGDFGETPEGIEYPFRGTINEMIRLYHETAGMDKKGRIRLPENVFHADALVTAAVAVGAKKPNATAAPADGDRRRHLAALQELREKHWPIWFNPEDLPKLCEVTGCSRHGMWALLEKYSPDVSESARQAWESASDQCASYFVISAWAHSMLGELRVLNSKWISIGCCNPNFLGGTTRYPEVFEEGDLRETLGNFLRHAVREGGSAYGQTPEQFFATEVLEKEVLRMSELDRMMGMYIPDEEAACKILAEVNSVDAGIHITPLMLAAFRDDDAGLEFAKVLCEWGADVNMPDDNVGATPLWMAAQEGKTALLRFLVEKGAFVMHTQHDSPTTPLWIAAQNGHVGCVSVLLSTGAVNVDATNREGKTPLCIAVQQGWPEVAGALATGGADFNSGCPAYGASEGGRNDRPLRAALQSKVSKVCLHCQKSPEKLQRCTKCNWVVFCGRECQVAVWDKHRSTCKAIARGSEMAKEEAGEAAFVESMKAQLGHEGARAGGEAGAGAGAGALAAPPAPAPVGATAPDGQGAVTQQACCYADCCTPMQLMPKKLLVCTRCRTVKYCSVDCQRAHWKEHRRQCGTSTKTETFIMDIAAPDGTTHSLTANSAMVVNDAKQALGKVRD